MAEYIDREAALKAVSFLAPYHMPRTEYAVKNALRDVPAIKLVRANPWLPVDEVAGRTDGYYLVWTDNSGVEKCRWSERHQRWMGGLWTQHITHWRPMPMGPGR